MCLSITYDLMFSFVGNGQVHHYVWKKPRSLHFFLFWTKFPPVSYSHTTKAGAEKTVSSNVIIMWWAHSKDPMKWKITFESVQQHTSPQGSPRRWYRLKVSQKSLPVCSQKKTQIIFSCYMVNVLWSSDVMCSSAHQLAKPLPISFLSGPLVIKSAPISISWVL